MDKYKTAGLRLGAYFTDSIIIIPVSLIVSYLFLEITSIRDSFVLYFLILSNSIVAIYYIYMHAKGGQTFGKRIFEIKVVDLSGSEITLQQSIFRSIPQLIQILVLVLLKEGFKSPTLFVNEKYILGELAQVFFIGMQCWHVADFLAVISHDKHRALHDFIAGTVVVKT